MDSIGQKIPAILAVVVFLCSVWVAADAVDDEYSKRSKALSPSDAKGHFELAKWCREKEKWQLVGTQCRCVLAIEPNHRQARLLLDIARAHLSKQEPGNRGGGGRPGSGGGVGPRMLNDDEVQRIRRSEMYPDDRERVVVTVDRQGLREFHDWARGEGLVEYDRRAFFRLSRLQQAQLILRYAAEEFGGRITVKSDPQRLRTFVRKVQPIVLRGCATIECHGGPSGGKFRLIGGRTLGANASYANFLIMHEHGVGEQRVINRDQPNRSLLVTYGLPSGASDGAKAFSHPTAIAPVFPDERNRDYRTVLDWLSSLSIDRPDYGIDLKPGR